MRKEFAKQYDAMEADEEDHSAPPSAGTAGPRPSDDELLERRRAALKTFQLPSSVVSQRVSALLPKKKVTFQEEPPFPPPMEKPLPLTSPPGYFGEVAADSKDDEREAKVKPAALDEKPLSRLKAFVETNLSPDEVEKSAPLNSTDKGEKLKGQVNQNLKNKLAEVRKNAQDVLIKGQHRQKTKDDKNQLSSIKAFEVSSGGCVAMRGAGAV